MIDKETDLKSWTGAQLLDVLKILINAQPREIKIMDARDEAVKRLKAELVLRPQVLFDFVETRLRMEK